MNCLYCNEEITDKQDLALNQRLVDRLGDEAEPMHILSGDCAAQAEIDHYASRAHLMKGRV